MKELLVRPKENNFGRNNQSRFIGMRYQKPFSIKQTHKDLDSGDGSKMDKLIFVTIVSIVMCLN